MAIRAISIWICCLGTPSSFPERRSFMTRKMWRSLALLVLIPLPLLGQNSAESFAAGGQPNPPATTVSIHGTGTFPDPSPEGLVGSRDLLSFGTDFSAGYDDNVRQNNESRFADTSFAISPMLDFHHQDGRLAMAMSYRPTLFFYQNQAAYNEQDHDFDLDGTYRLTNRLALRVQTDLLDRRGLLEPVSGAATRQLTTSLGLLNDSITAPFANQLEDNSRTDISYALSPRASVGIFATYMLRSFGKSPADSVTPFSTQGESEGFRYVSRATPRTTLGLTYLHEDFHTGGTMRVGLDTALIDWSLAVSHRLKISASAGPEHSIQDGAVLVPLGPLAALSLPLNQGNWHWAATAAFGFETAQTSLQMDGSRQVTDGGGLLEAVTSDAVGERFERRLCRFWSIRISARWQRNVNLAGPGQPGQLEGEYGRVVVLHPISETLAAGVGYQLERQRATGMVPLGASFDRNYAYFTLSYRISNFPLGR